MEIIQLYGQAPDGQFNISVSYAVYKDVFVKKLPTFKLWPYQTLTHGRNINLMMLNSTYRIVINYQMYQYL